MAGHDAAISSFLGLPGLRGFWPMSSVDEAGTVYDLSGQGRHLTSVGSMSFGRTENNFPMVDFADSYLERADEPGLDCTNFTVGGWFRMKTTVDEEIRLLDKTNFCLKIRNTLGRVENIVRLDPYNNYTTLATDDGIIVSEAWNFLAIMCDVSVGLGIHVNGVLVAEDHTPVTPYDTALPFRLGAYSNVSPPYAVHKLNGYESLVFLCGERVPDVRLKQLYDLTAPLFV